MLCSNRLGDSVVSTELSAVNGTSHVRILSRDLWIKQGKQRRSRNDPSPSIVIYGSSKPQGMRSAINSKALS